MKQNIGADIFNLLRTYNHVYKHILKSNDLPQAFLNLEKKGYKQDLEFKGKYVTPLISLTPPNSTQTIRFQMLDPVMIIFVNEEKDNKAELILKFTSYNKLIDEIFYQVNNKTVKLTVEELTGFIFNNDNSIEKEMFNLLHDIQIDLDTQLAEFKTPIKNILMMSIGKSLQEKLRNKM